MSNNRRIASNTLALYVRMLFSMLVSLYTARIILSVLGVVDFGTYNVVWGIVTMFSFINASLATGTQRFITIELGKNNFKQLKNVFCMSINVHIVISFVVLLLAETLGLWFLNNKLVIPIERLEAANWIYQLSVVSAIISTTQVPYTASIIAHENFKIYAYVGVMEVLLRLLVVFLLVYIPWDKLILFGVLSLTVSSGLAMYYRIYCKRKFEECSYAFIWDKNLFQSLVKFSGWSLFGNVSHILLTQGMNILINLFFGVTVNAARAVTVQVEQAINNFVNNFMIALNPQITKDYAMGNIKEMNSLMKRGAKFSFYIFFILSLPVFIEIDTILHVWLEFVPDYSVVFIRLSLIVTLIYSMTNTYLTGIFAAGDIGKYQSKIAIMVSVFFLLTYVLLEMGFSPEITYVIYIVISVFVLIFRVTAVQKLLHISVREFIKEVFLKALIIVMISAPIPFMMSFLISPGIIRVILVISFSLVISSTVVFYFGLTKSEKEKIIYYIFSKFKIPPKKV